MILGDPGTGKTHTLMRAARTLGHSNRILFVPKPTNRDTVAQHIWRNVVESLARTLPGGGERCQLDDLLAHVFRDVLVPRLEEDIAANKDAERKRRWVEKLRADPHNLFTMLGDGEQRQKNFEAIRTRTLNAVRSAHPEVDSTITRALITYCLTVPVPAKRQLLDWLRGIELDADDAKRLGLPPLLTPLDQSADDDSVGRSREDQSQRAIVTVATLSTHYQPLFLAFDELEGLRDDKELTAAWGNVVRYLFTSAPNMLIVTCVFPSLWRNWFEPLTKADSNVKSLAERVAGNVVELEAFSAKYALGLIAGCMAVSVERHGLPSNIYPFEMTDIDEIGRHATTAREFIREAKQRYFEPWVEEAAPPPPPPPSEQVTWEQVERLVLAELATRYAEEKQKKNAWATDDQDFLARLNQVLKAVLAHSGEEATFERLAGRGVMPPTFVVRSAGVAPAVVAVVAASHAEGNSLAASVRNLLAALDAGGHVPSAVLMRYQACSDAVGVTADNLNRFTTGRGHYLRTVRDEIALVNAVYQVLVAVEEADLTVGRLTVTKPQFVRALRAWEPAKQSQIVRQVASRFPPLLRALGLQAPAAPPTATLRPQDSPPRRVAGPTT